MFNHIAPMQRFLLFSAFGHILLILISAIGIMSSQKTTFVVFGAHSSKAPKSLCILNNKKNIALKTKSSGPIKGGVFGIKKNILQVKKYTSSSAHSMILSTNKKATVTKKNVTKHHAMLPQREAIVADIQKKYAKHSIKKIPLLKKILLDKKDSNKKFIKKKQIIEVTIKPELATISKAKKQPCNTIVNIKKVGLVKKVLPKKVLHKKSSVPQKKIIGDLEVQVSNIGAQKKLNADIGTQLAKMPLSVVAADEDVLSIMHTNKEQYDHALLNEKTNITSNNNSNNNLHNVESDTKNSGSDDDTIEYNFSDEYSNENSIVYQQHIQKEVDRLWRPPIGVPKGTVCTIIFTVSTNGEVTCAFGGRSSILIYDLSIMHVAQNFVFDKSLWGKEFKIAFRQ